MLWQRRELCLEDAREGRERNDRTLPTHRLHTHTHTHTVLDGGHSGDAREVDERRSGPHQREREGATQGELVSVTRKEGNIDNTSRD